jgi:limonene 1,2-monooxygenase
MVQLDHMTNGRAIFGSGPGALPSDAYVLGIDPVTQRDRQDEALGVIRRLLRGEERFSHKSDWFTLNDARLQLLPLQEDMPFAVASMVSPSGMTLAGKYDTGVLSIGSMSSEGLNALPTQWSFAEDSALKHGNTVDRKNWRIVLQWHIAETREEAIAQSKEGLFHWHNEYNVGTLMRPGVEAFKTPNEGVDKMAFSEGATAVIGTPDDLVKRLRDLIALTGGYGVTIGFVHDWANRENTLRSWDLVMRYVVPELNGLLTPYRESQDHVRVHRDSFASAQQGILNKIMENPKAAAALGKTKVGVAAAIGPHAGPDLAKASEDAKAK